MQQVGLAQAALAVDEQRVVHRPRSAGHVQRRGAGHLVGAAGHQRVERERRIEPMGIHCRGDVHRAGLCRRGQAHMPVRRRGERMLEHGADALRRMRCDEAAAGGYGGVAVCDGFATWGQRQLQAHRLAGQLGQHGLDARSVLRPDPVELEAVGHAHERDRAVADIGEVGRRQGPDPGAELLFGQLGRKAFATPVPKV